MRIEEYFETELDRLGKRVSQALATGGDQAALIYMRRTLTLYTAVLDGDPCPPTDPPSTTGVQRWDIFLRALLIDVLDQQWSASSPLAEPWFPAGKPENTDDRAAVIVATPLTLTVANIFIRREQLCGRLRSDGGNRFIGGSWLRSSGLPADRFSSGPRPGS